MSTFRNPVGPQPAKVYWRRRLLVGLGLVAVIVIIILIVSQPRGGTPTPAGTKTSTSTPAPSGTATNGTTTGSGTQAGEECDPKRVTVTAGTDAADYSEGVQPVLTFSLKSSETVACTFSAGSDVQVFEITSGDELIWSSKDCQTGAVAAVVTLQPGVPFPGPSLTWDRTRSSTDTCDVARDPVIAGGASYHLGVTVNGVESASTKQFLLN